MGSGNVVATRKVAKFNRGTLKCIMGKLGSTKITGGKLAPVKGALSKARIPQIRSRNITAFEVDESSRTATKLRVLNN
jgi:hypothetical protein